MLGQVVVPPVDDYASRFFNGHAIVGMKNESVRLLSGLIDRTGRVVVPLEWEVLSNEEYVYALIDPDGNAYCRSPW